MKYRAWINRVCWAVLVYMGFWHVAVAEERPASEGSWVRVVDQPDLGLTIDTRAMQGTNVREFRGETVVKATLASLMATIQDTERVPQWMPHVAKVTLVSPDKDQHSEIYLVIHVPWPLHDRDAFVDVRWSQDASTHAVHMVGRSRMAGAGLQVGCVRMPEMDMDWTFTPLGHGKVRVVFRGFGLPGGVVPNWAANLVVTELPEGSLKHLQVQVDLPRHQRVSMPGLVEPQN